MLYWSCGAANSGRCAGGSFTCAGSRVFAAPTGCRIFVFRGFIIAKFLCFGKRYFYIFTVYSRRLKEVNTMPSEKEIKIIQQATIYELRRLLKNSGKDTYTLEELCNLLDTIADAKDQE